MIGFQVQNVIYKRGERMESCKADVKKNNNLAYTLGILEKIDALEVKNKLDSQQLFKIS